MVHELGLDEGDVAGGFCAVHLDSLQCSDRRDDLEGVTVKDKAGRRWSTAGFIEKPENIEDLDKTCTKT